MGRQRAWVIKCTEKEQGKSKGWHWNRYFPPAAEYDPGEVWDHWGGGEWIRSHQSMTFLREELGAGDLAVCYQKDDPQYGRAILGLARFVSDGKEEDDGSGRYNCFDLCAPNDYFRLDSPLTIDDLRATGCDPECFKPGARGTTHPVWRAEFNGIVAAMLEHSPKQEKALRKWLARAGWR
jgi:hypothetical protein